MGVQRDDSVARQNEPCDNDIFFFATLLVVACHTDDIMPRESQSFLVRFFGGAFSDANVCNFFFLSGFLLARHFGEIGWWKKAITSRIRSLAIPYIAWCVLYFLTSGKLGLFIGEIGSAFTAADGGLMPAVIVLARIIRRGFGVGFLTAPYDFALWYIKTLFYFVLVASVALPVVLATKRRFLGCLGIVLAFFVLGHGLHLSIMPYFGFCFHLLGFAAFLSGAYCATHGILDLPDSLMRTSPIVPLVLWLIVSLIYITISPEIKGGVALLGPVNIAISMLCLVWISFTVNWRIPESVSKCSFFIYAAHLMVLRVQLCFLPPGSLNRAGSFLMFVVYLSGAIAICIGLAHATSRICPQVASVLSGGRIERISKCNGSKK